MVGKESSRLFTTHKASVTLSPAHIWEQNNSWLCVDPVLHEGSSVSAPSASDNYKMTESTCVVGWWDALSTDWGTQSSGCFHTFTVQSTEVELGFSFSFSVQSVCADATAVNTLRCGSKQPHWGGCLCQGPHEHHNILVVVWTGSNVTQVWAKRLRQRTTGEQSTVLPEILLR